VPSPPFESETFILPTLDVLWVDDTTVRNDRRPTADLLVAIDERKLSTSALLPLVYC